MGFFGSGISVNTGFDLGSPRPLDSRTWVQTHKEMIDMPAIRKFVNLKTYVADDKAQYKWTGTEWVLDQAGLKSGAGSPAADYGDPGDMYIDSDNGDVWYLGYDAATNSMKWVLLFNMQGAGGEQGPVGPQGVRGSLWSTGTMITGTSSVGTVFPSSGIAQSNVKDLYLNISTGFVYECTKAGNPATAEWAYVTSIMGPRGEQGEKGLTGDAGERGERGERGEQGNRGTNTTVITANYETTPADMVLPGVAGSGIIKNDQAINSAYGHLFTALSAGNGDTVKWRRIAVISGSKIYIGDKISTTGTANISVPDSGLPYVNQGDIYINNVTGQLFMCITEGVPKYATWKPNGTLVIGSAINDPLGNKIVSYIRNIAASDNTLSITHGDGTVDTVTVTQPVFTGATQDKAGKMGSVPAPNAGDTNLMYLNANGQWKTLPTMSSTIPGIAKLGNTLTISSDGILDTKAHTHTQSQIDGLENRLNQMQEEIDSKPDTATGTIENAKTANKLKNPVNVQISGGVTADPVQFDGSADLNLVVNSVDTSKLKGTIDPKNLPASAIPTLKVVESEEAMLQLTINDVQNGDLVQVDTIPAVIYYVVDDTKLNSMDGYRQLTAGAASSVPWTGVTGKPDVYPPDSHTHNESDINGLTNKLSSMQTDIDGRYKKTDIVEKAKFDQHGNSLLDKVSDLTITKSIDGSGKTRPAVVWTTYDTDQDGGKQVVNHKDFLTPWVMNGADNITDGMEGIVPQPKAGDAKKVLAGSGNWVEIPVPTYQDIVIKTTDWTKSTGSEVFTCDVVCDTTITDDTIITLIPVAEAENLKQIWYSFVIGISQDNTANTIKFQAQYQPTADVKYKLQFVKYYTI